MQFLLGAAVFATGVFFGAVLVRASMSASVKKDN